MTNEELMTTVLLLGFVRDTEEEDDYTELIFSSKLRNLIVEIWLDHSTKPYVIQTTDAYETYQSTDELFTDLLTYLEKE